MRIERRGLYRAAAAPHVDTRPRHTGRATRLTKQHDDGIVVVEVGRLAEVGMAAPDLGFHLRDRLGSEAAEALSCALEEIQHDMLALTADRVEARLDARLSALATELRLEIARTQAELRQEVAYGNTTLRVAVVEGLSRMGAEIAAARVDALRWSLALWLGQVVVTALLMAFMPRSR
jgi:hypothetical protein